MAGHFDPLADHEPMALVEPDVRLLMRIKPAVRCLTIGPLEHRSHQGAADSAALITGVDADCGKKPMWHGGVIVMQSPGDFVISVQDAKAAQAEMPRDGEHAGSGLS